jgi:hypothetical protein
MAEQDTPPSQDYEFDDFNTPVSDEARELLEKIEQSHAMRYKMMNLETWSLAKTMDAFLPGFWNRFLENRRLALKKFIEQRRKFKTQDDLTQDDDLLEDLAAEADTLSPEMSPESEPLER